MAEAGRELGRYDSRPWLAELTPSAAVIVTSGDTAVPAYKQRELAERLDAPTYDAPGDHGAVVSEAKDFNARLLEALERVGAPAPAPVV